MAQDYAAWRVDYLKYDWCPHRGHRAAHETYNDDEPRARCHGAVRLSSVLCEWGRTQALDVGKSRRSSLWRTTDDIQDCWECAKDKYDSLSVVRHPRSSAPLARVRGTRRLERPDMLEVGNGWDDRRPNTVRTSRCGAMLAAPLIAGNDLRHMFGRDEDDPVERADVIAIDQGRPARQTGEARTRRRRSWKCGARPLAPMAVKWVALLNRGGAPATIRVNWSEDAPRGGSLHHDDLWTHKASPFQAGRDTKLPCLRTAWWPFASIRRSSSRLHLRFEDDLARQPRADHFANF
jgi:alpha-galactosidase